MLGIELIEKLRVGPDEILVIKISPETSSNDLSDLAACLKRNGFSRTIVHRGQLETISKLSTAELKNFIWMAECILMEK